jgi:rhodanese-related sulfurtransferase
MYRPLSKKSNTAWLWRIAIVALLISTDALSIIATAEDAAKTLPNEISVTQAKAKRDAGIFFLDVRNPDEWYPSHIAGSVLIPLGELEKRTKELPQDKEIVVVCRSGNRSSAGRDILKKAGFSQVTSMTGGMNAWNAAGYPTISGRK